VITDGPKTRAGLIPDPVNGIYNEEKNERRNYKKNKVYSLFFYFFFEPCKQIKLLLESSSKTIKLFLNTSNYFHDIFFLQYPV